MKLSAVVLVIAALGVTLVAASQTARGTAGVQTLPRMLGVVGRTNEHVSAATLGNSVALVWAATTPSGTDIYAATSGDAGSTFSSPVRVNATAGEAAVGGEQPPRVSLVRGSGSTPQVVVVWTAKGANGTRLLTARSSDAGKTFGTTSVVPGSDAAGNRGWQSIATDRSGRTVALWLDHRKLAGAPSAMTHDHAATAPTPAATPSASRPDPVERAGQSQLFFGALDGSSPARALTGGVCYCCKTSMTTGADGAIYAVWRHVYAGNERDIALMVSRDGGQTFSTPARVSRDAWQIDGCPENGPAIAVDGGGTVHIVWPTLVRERGSESLALFHATSRDGVTFSARDRLATAGAAYHPQIAVESDGSVVVAWDEVSPGGRQVAAARGRADATGRTRFTRIAGMSNWAGLYPALVPTPRGTSLAWVRRAGSGAMIALAPLPR